jgi:putative transposase
MTGKGLSPPQAAEVHPHGEALSGVSQTSAPLRLRADQTEERGMVQQAVRKTYHYKLTPTPQQERVRGRVLGLCRSLYNTVLEQRIVAWRRARVSVSRFQQETEVKDIRAAMPEYAAIHSHVLQDVLARLD